MRESFQKLETPVSAEATTDKPSPFQKKELGKPASPEKPESEKPEKGGSRAEASLPPKEAGAHEVEQFLDKEVEILAAYGLRGDITLERSDKGWAFDFENRRLMYDPNFFIERGYNLKEALFATTQVLNGQYAEFLENPELILKEERRNTSKPHLQLLRKSLMNALGGRRAVAAMPFLEDTRTELCEKRLSAVATEEKGNVPLHIQFIKEILREKPAKEGVSPEVRGALDRLRNFGQASTDILDLATTPSLKTEERFEIIKKIIEPAYLELYKKDMEDESKGRELFDEIDEGLPPEEQDEYFPQDMESRESKEKPPHIFKISPGIAGYYPGGVRNIFDQKTLRWRKDKKLAPYLNSVAHATREYQGKILGNIALPLPKGFAIDASSFAREGGGKIEIKRDQFGAFYASSGELKEFSFKFGEAMFSESSTPNKFLEELFSKKLSDQTEANLGKIKKLETAGEQAEQLINFIRKKYKYDVKAQGALYNKAKNAGHYFQSIDNAKSLECYTANTFFVALCRKLGIASRLITGHYISSLDEDGSAKITRSTGHAWAEIWDGNKWVLYDATPPAEGGDFKEKQDALDDTMPDPLPQKDKENMEKEMKELLDKKGGLPSLDRSILEQWAKEHGVNAEDVIAYRNEFREIEPLVQELREVFKKIVSKRLRERMRLSPQLQKEGEELEEGTLAEVYAESKAGGEPRAFREIERRKREEVGYGVLDITLVCDLSGSMTADENENYNPEKLNTQRKSAMLVLETLADFQKEIDEAEYESGMSLGLGVRTEVRTFYSKNDEAGENIGIDEEVKSLSRELPEKKRMTIWKKLQTNNGGTPDFLPLETISKSITSEYEQELRSKTRRKVVVVLSDGASGDQERYMKTFKELEQRGVIMVDLGMLTSARPGAEVIDDIKKLPQAVQKVILKYIQDL